MKQTWNTDRVIEVQKYMRDNKVSLETASKQLKFGMASYYKYRNLMPKRPYTKRIQLNVEPHYDILPKQFQTKNKIVILITDISSAKNLINEIF